MSRVLDLRKLDESTFAKLVPVLGPHCSDVTSLKDTIGSQTDHSKHAGIALSIPAATAETVVALVATQPVRVRGRSNATATSPNVHMRVNSSQPSVEPLTPVTFAKTLEAVLTYRNRGVPPSASTGKINSLHRAARATGQPPAQQSFYASFSMWLVDRFGLPSLVAATKRAVSRYVSAAALSDPLANLWQYLCDTESSAASSPQAVEVSLLTTVFAALSAAGQRSSDGLVSICSTKNRRHALSGLRSQYSSQLIASLRGAMSAVVRAADALPLRASSVYNDAPDPTAAAAATVPAVLIVAAVAAMFPAAVDLRRQWFGPGPSCVQNTVRKYMYLIRPRNISIYSAPPRSRAAPLPSSPKSNPSSSMFAGEMPSPGWSPKKRTIPEQFLHNGALSPQPDVSSVINTFLSNVTQVSATSAASCLPIRAGLKVKPEKKASIQQKTSESSPPILYSIESHLMHHAPRNTITRSNISLYKTTHLSPVPPAPGKTTARDRSRRRTRSTVHLQSQERSPSRFHDAVAPGVRRSQSARPERSVSADERSLCHQCGALDSRVPILAKPSDRGGGSLPATPNVSVVAGTQTDPRMQLLRFAPTLAGELVTAIDGDNCALPTSSVRPLSRQSSTVCVARGGDEPITTEPSPSLRVFEAGASSQRSPIIINDDVAEDVASDDVAAVEALLQRASTFLQHEKGHVGSTTVKRMTESRLVSPVDRPRREPSCGALVSPSSPSPPVTRRDDRVSKQPEKRQRSTESALSETETVPLSLLHEGGVDLQVPHQDHGGVRLVRATPLPDDAPTAAAFGSVTTHFLQGHLPNYHNTDPVDAEVRSSRPQPASPIMSSTFPRTASPILSEGGVCDVMDSAINHPEGVPTPGDVRLQRSADVVEALMKVIVQGNVADMTDQGLDISGLNH